MNSTEITADRPVVRRLRALGVDVQQLAHEPLPDELWEIIRGVVCGIRGKRVRWYAAAAMYGRFVTVLKSGGTAAGLTEQFAAGKLLAPLFRQAEMRELVLAANLPGSLNGWLAEAVRRTRLNRREKATVADMLIRQIQSGLSAGDSTVEIIDRLGQPRSIARRLRREMLKQRPWLWRAFRWTCRAAASLALVLAVTITWLLYRYYTIQAVDMGDEIERRDALAAAVPVEQRAWPVYVAGLEKIDLLEPQESMTILAACESGPKHASWPAAAEYIARNRDAIDLFVQAAAIPRLGYIRRDSGNDGWLRKFNQGPVDQVFRKVPRRNMLLPELSAFRLVSPLLAGSAHAAAAAGDPVRALDCAGAIARLAQHVWAHEDRLVTRMIALQMFRLATQTISALLAEYGDSWGEDELILCLRGLQVWNKSWRNDLLTAMRQTHRDDLRSMYSGDGQFTREGFQLACALSPKPPQLTWLDEIRHSDPRNPDDVAGTLLTPLVGACLAPFVARLDEQLKASEALNDLYDVELQQQAEGGNVSSPYTQRMESWLDSKQTQIQYLPLLVEVRFTALNFLDRVINKGAADATDREVTQIVIACRLYRRRHADWPASVAALVPEFLESPPRHAFDGQPLRLVIIQDQPFVYSVGYDRKDQTAATPAEKRAEIDRRDVQLFPPPDPKAGAEPAK